MATSNFDPTKIDRFFGSENIKWITDVGFQHKHYISEDVIFIETNNVKWISKYGRPAIPVLAISPHYAVYLKSWLFRKVHTENGRNLNVVKVERSFFKPYKFKKEFTNCKFTPNTTDSTPMDYTELSIIAQDQDELNPMLIEGHLDRFGELKQ